MSQTDDKRPAKYHEVTRNWPPSPLLVEAVEHVARKGKAIDIGAGAFRDTRRLLAEGFAVTAIDRDAELAELAKTIDPQRLRFIPADFDCFDFPESEYDLACAMFALPFNPPQTFDRVFADIKRSLADGGVLCCTLFGTDDTWSGDSKKTFHTRARVESLVSDLKLIALSEDEWDGMPAVGPRKHWHVFFIIAQKPGKGAEHERGWSRPSGKTMPQAENDGWSKFHELTKEAPTSRLLVGAIEQLGRTGKAIDIGAGAFKDTRHLLAGGFDVTAIDSAPASSEAAKAIVSPKLRFVATAFDHFDFPEAEYDLASAMYALPFNPPETFDRLFAGITRSLVSGGVFCGTFFGTRDEWSGERNMTFHTRQQVKTLLSGLTLIRLSEDERDGTTADGTLKHWHVFYVTCRKP